MPHPSKNSFIEKIVKGLANTFWSLMQQNDVPGGQLAVLVGKDGLIEINLGTSDNGTTPVNNMSVFRVASNSKPWTAVAIRKLEELGFLNLNDRPYCDPQIPGCQVYCTTPGILARALKLPINATIAAGQCITTIRDLLEMSGGFCEHPALPGSACQNLTEVDNIDFFASYTALEMYGYNISNPLTPPASLEQLIGQLMTFEPEFLPGSDWNYCNSCHDALSAIVAATVNITSTDYALTYQNYLLSLAKFFKHAAPRIGLAATNKLPNEVTYFPNPPDPVPSVYPPIFTLENNNTGNPAYFGEYIPSKPGCGGWVLSASEMVRFIYDMGEPFLINSGRPGILQPETIADMWKKPNITLFANATKNWPGQGFDAVYDNLVFNISGYNDTYYWVLKNGALPGTNSWLATSGKTAQGLPPITLAFVINSNFNLDPSDYIYSQFKQIVLDIRYPNRTIPTTSPMPTFNVTTGKAYYGGIAFGVVPENNQFSPAIYRLFRVISPQYFLGKLEHDVTLSALTTLITALLSRLGADKEASTLALQICHVGFMAAHNELKIEHFAVQVMSGMLYAFGMPYSRAVPLSQLVIFTFSIGLWMPTNFIALTTCTVGLTISILGAKVGSTAVNGITTALLGSNAPNDSTEQTPQTKKVGNKAQTKFFTEIPVATIRQVPVDANLEHGPYFNQTYTP